MGELTNEELRQKLSDDLDAKFFRAPSHQDHVLIRLKDALVDPGYYDLPAGAIGLGQLVERSILSADLEAVDGYSVVFVDEHGDTTSTQAYVHEVEVLYDPAHEAAEANSPSAGR
jgi:hypothetical protein